MPRSTPHPGGRPRVPRAKKRSRVVTMWLTPSEYAAVSARVKADKTTISEWFREHGLAQLGLKPDEVTQG